LQETPSRLQVDVVRPVLAGYGRGVVLSARFGELDEAPLARSPIVSVVWQLRFEDHPTLAAPEAVLRFQELLGGAEQFSFVLLPKIELTVQAASPAGKLPGPAASATGGGWRLSAIDDSWQISANSGSLAVETTRYGTWEKDFSPRLEKVLGVLQEIGAPVIESRLGLRYVNVVTSSVVRRPPISAASELAGLIAPWLLGPLNEPSLRDSVQASQGRVAFSFEQSNATLNHGVISTETSELGYLIDIDAFREGGRALRIDDVLRHSAVLHSMALGLFQASLTPSALEMMRSDPADLSG
jgi:uncharacterized protein (TIGR04255 family)